MRRIRHQRGYLFRKGSSWYLRYYDFSVKEGQVERAQKCHKLAEAEGPYRSKRSVQVLADEFLRPLNDGSLSPESTMTLAQFHERTYAPYMQEQLRASTKRDYAYIWKHHLEPRIGSHRLRDFRTYHGERVLSEIARANGNLSHERLKRIKNALSAMFTYARRVGVLSTPNPVTEVAIPRGRSLEEDQEPYAYSLSEIVAMLQVLPEPASIAIAAAAHTGMRYGELDGLRWEDYDGDVILIRRSKWRNVINAPKTRKSKAPIPVIDALRSLLDGYRERLGGSATGKMFTFSLQYVTREVIRPTLATKGLKWHGWHAFRRGLGTNLAELGVELNVIQALLRHGNMQITLEHYVKTREHQAVAAMQTLNHAVASASRSQVVN